MRLIICHIIYLLSSQELDFDYPYYTTYVNTLVNKNRAQRNFKVYQVDSDFIDSLAEADSISNTDSQGLSLKSVSETNPKTDLAPKSSVEVDTKIQGKSSSDLLTNTQPQLNTDLLSGISSPIDGINLNTASYPVSKKTQPILSQDNNLDPKLKIKIEERINKVDDLEKWRIGKEDRIKKCIELNPKNLNILYQAYTQAEELIKRKGKKIQKIQLETEPFNHQVDNDRYKELSDVIGDGMAYLHLNVNDLNKYLLEINNKIESIQKEELTIENHLKQVQGFKITIESYKNKTSKLNNINDLNNGYDEIVDIMLDKNHDIAINRNCEEEKVTDIIKNIQYKIDSVIKKQGLLLIIRLMQGIIIIDLNSKQIEQDLNKQLALINASTWTCENKNIQPCGIEKNIFDIKNSMKNALQIKSNYQSYKRLKIKYNEFQPDIQQTIVKPTEVNKYDNYFLDSAKRSRTGVKNIINVLIQKVNQKQNELDKNQTKAFINDLKKIEDPFKPIIMAPFSLKFLNQDLFKNYPLDYFTKQNYINFLSKIEGEFTKNKKLILDYTNNEFKSTVYDNLYKTKEDLKAIEKENKRLKELGKELKKILDQLVEHLITEKDYNWINELRTVFTQLNPKRDSLDQIKEAFNRILDNKKLDVYNKIIKAISETFEKRKDFKNLRTLAAYTYKEHHIRAKIIQTADKIEKDFDIEKDKFYVFKRQEEFKAKSIFNKDIDSFKLTMKEYFKKKLTEGELVVQYRLDGIRREDYQRFQALKHDLKLEEKYLKLSYKKEADNIKMDIKKYFKIYLSQLNNILQAYLDTIHNS